MSLPSRLMVGTKYVLESHGLLVRRFIEFPDGRKIHLASRRALTCDCMARQQISIVPDHDAPVVDPAPPRRRQLEGPQSDDDIVSDTKASLDSL